MIIKKIVLLSCCWLLSCFANAAFGQAKDVYMFCYFTRKDPKGLKLAYSYDGLRFTELNKAQPFMTPIAGKDSLFRDPDIIKGKDGVYHMVFTVNWEGKQIGYASSKDLVHWSNKRYIPVMESEPLARNSWAPEILYNEAKKEYLIYWSTSIQGRFPETDSSSESGYDHRIYYVATKDFKRLSQPALLYNHGFSVIDATIDKDGDEYIMFLKDETKFPHPEKNIHIAKSKYADSGYSAPSAPITGSDYWAEGPTAIKINGQWMLYFDKYRNHRFSLLTSQDLEHWRDISSQLTMPEDAKHGSIFTISKKEFQQYFYNYLK